MSDQLLENPIKVARLVCEALGTRIEDRLVDNEGVRFTSLKTPKGGTAFRVSSPALQLIVAPKLDGSIEFSWPGKTWPESGKFLPFVNGSHISLSNCDKALTVEAASDLLINPFFYSPVN